MSRKRTIVERRREELLAEMLKQRDPSQCEAATLSSPNDDIPKFLRRLKRAKERFRKSELWVG